jgi:putative transposase
MREQKLIQRRPVEARRRRPGVFKVECPGQLWHLDMTSVWVAERGWVYLNAIIDCCTREIVGWSLELRCRAAEATAVIKQAVDEQRIPPGTLTLGTDNGSAFTARATRLAISALGVTHRRGGCGHRALPQPRPSSFARSRCCLSAARRASRLS